MKRFTISLAAVLLLVATVAFALQVGAAGVITSEAAAGSGAFTSPTALLGVNLSSSTFGSGVTLNPDGTATGEYSTVLSGSDAVTGLPASVTVEAQVTAGTANPDGSVTLKGAATVTTASQTLTGVPVTAVMTTLGINLTVGTITLSPQSLTEGAIYLGQ